MLENRIRIFMTGVGGQGTLTATTLLAKAALDYGLEVVAGEVHGMAQRGGVVESVVLLGGWLSPKLCHSEADILMGFEPLETLRALPYLAPKGLVFSSSDYLPPLSVSLGKHKQPSLSSIKDAVNAKAEKSWFIAARSIGLGVGSVQCGNIALLGCVCAAKAIPLDVSFMDAAIRKYLPAKIVESNLSALYLGAELAV